MKGGKGAEHYAMPVGMLRERRLNRYFGQQDSSEQLKVIPVIQKAFLISGIERSKVGI